jgi:DNA-binding winged helix-turn-helix (wHTH) protein
MSAGEQPSTLYEFGPFRVDLQKEILFRDGKPVPLTPKAFQILLVLIRHGTEMVSKSDLMNAVWPDTFVEEANLSRNIFLLRKALGEGPQDHRYVLTVPGRGYRLAESVQLVPRTQQGTGKVTEQTDDLSIVGASQSRIQFRVEDRPRRAWITITGIVALALAGLISWRLWPHHSS